MFGKIVRFTRNVLSVAFGATSKSAKPRLRLAVFGGSFSVTEESQVAKAGWRKALGCAIDDYGIGGCGFRAGAEAGNDVFRQVTRALASGVPYDAFVLWASTNDVRFHDVSLQNDGIERTAALIREKAPAAKIVFFTSMPVPLSPEIHEPLAGFVDEQIRTCEKLGVPVLDLYARSGVTATNAVGLFKDDQLHPTRAGYERVRALQVAFLRELL